MQRPYIIMLFTTKGGRIRAGRCHPADGHRHGHHPVHDQQCSEIAQSHARILYLRRYPHHAPAWSSLAGIFLAHRIQPHRRGWTAGSSSSPAARKPRRTKRQAGRRCAAALRLRLRHADRPQRHALPQNPGGNDRDAGSRRLSRRARARPVHRRENPAGRSSCRLVALRGPAQFRHQLRSGLCARSAAARVLGLLLPETIADQYPQAPSCTGRSRRARRAGHAGDLRRCRPGAGSGAGARRAGNLACSTRRWRWN